MHRSACDGPPGLRIAYVGNFRHPWCTEVHLARTLEQLGHTVYRLQEDHLNPATLTRALKGRQATDGLDLFWFTRTWGRTVTLDHLAWLDAQGIPSIAYHLDLYVPLARGRNIDRDPFWRCTHVFTPDGDPHSADTFAAAGINHHWMLPAVVADECYLADVPLTRDVVFVGSRQYHAEWPYRGQLLDWLERTYGDRFGWHGPENGGVVRGDDLNRLYASTRVAIGDSLVPGYTHVGYASDRRYEAPGRGAFQIGPRIAGLDDGFVDGVSTVLYDFGDWDGLRDRISHYLTRDDERERIRRAGHNHVKAHHTYTNRLTAALALIGATR